MAKNDTQELLSAKIETPPHGARLDVLIMIVGAGWVLFTLLHLMKGRMLHAAIDLGVLALTGILWVIVRQVEKEHHRWLAHVNLGISITGLGVVSLLSGQGDAMALWYMAAAPLLAVFQSGARAAVLWAILVSIALAGIHLSGDYFYLAPEYVSSGQELLFGQMFLVGLVLGFAIASFRTTKHYIARIQHHEELMREKAIALRRNATELERARDQAVRASNIKSQFLANVSHEIKTPLNGVLGMVSVLFATPLTPEQHQILRTIDKSGKSLLSIINDLLDFSKLEAGGVQIETVAFDLRECIEDVLDLFSGPSYEKGLDLGYTMREDVPTRVMGDVTRFRQILLNLVNNGVKFTEKGEVRVEVSMLEEQILVSVIDTGIGIDEAHQHKLFASFSQVDASTTRKYGGTGLGLAISKRIAELMGGKIWVESKLGEGAAFRFTSNVQALDPAIAADVSGWDLDWLDPAADHLTLFEKQILLVASPGISRDTLISFAMQWGMDVFLVLDPVRIRHNLELEPDLAMAVFFAEDYRPEHLEAVREHRPNLPIVLVGTLADPQSVASETGFQGTIYRPLRYRQVVHTFEGLLGGQASTVPKVPRSLNPFDGEFARRIPMRVLVAEDNLVNQKVAEAMLRGLGYDPHIVATGAQALELNTETEFDVILMDMHMPEVDGLEATRRIRQKSGMSRPWIVALTASSLEEQRQQCLDAGMNDFIGKPIEIESLIGALERYGKARGITTSNDMVSALERDEEPLMRLKEVFAKQPDKYNELIKDHIENGRELIGQIDDTLHQENWGGLEVAAHSLKGSASLFGSTRVSELAQRLEVSAKNKGTGDASKLFEALVQAWAKSEIGLQSEIERNRTTVSPSEASHS